MSDPAALTPCAGGATLGAMLIDDRVPPFSEPDQRVWEPDWRQWAWNLAAVAATVACFATEGLTGFVLLCVAVACGCHAISRALPYGGGLREHRQ